MSEFRMPSLGADMEDGTLVEWLKQPGDTVTRGDVIAVVETQKGAIEVEVFEDGVFAETLVELGTTVPVGTPLAIIDSGEGGAAAPEPEPVGAPSRGCVVAPAAPAPPSMATAPATPSVATAAAATGSGRLRASPAARRLAAEQGVNLAGLAGSGPGGAVISDDIGKDAVAARETAPAGGLDLAEMRKAIAAAMARSKREIPHYYLETRIDLEPANRWLAETNADREPADRLLMAALLHKAVALALRKHAAFNGFFEAGAFRPADSVHLGIAIAIRGGGLMAPAIHDADTLSVDAMMAALRDLVVRVRAGRIRGSEMMDPTATVTSLGERGADTVHGVIFPPQVALLGFGRPAPQVWPLDHGIESRLTVNATLAADHRVSDGIAGARLLETIGRLLQEPETL